MYVIYIRKCVEILYWRFCQDVTSRKAAHTSAGLGTMQVSMVSILQVTSIAFCPEPPSGSIQ